MEKSEIIKKGWLINDCLTCIPNTKTFWHDMLDWIPGLVDKTNGYTDYTYLADVIERDAQLNGNPDYIVRNCTFFRKLNINTKTISLLQDYYPNLRLQIDVANSSDVVVFNSPFTYSLYKDVVKSRVEIISLGVDSDSFTPLNKDYSEELGILPNSILFVGQDTIYPKGFDLMLDIINNTNYNYCLVMKIDYNINHPRVKVFNKVSKDTIIKIYNSCKMILCTSKMETQHLGGIEAGLSGLPIIATNVGIYYNIEHGEWGRKASNLNEFKNEIQYVFDNYDSFKPRNYFLKMGYDLNSCKNKWEKLINNIDG